MSDSTEREQVRMFVEYLTVGGSASEGEIRDRLASLREEHLSTGKSVLKIVAARMANGNGKPHGVPG